MLYQPDAESIPTTGPYDIFILPEGPKTLAEGDPWNQALCEALSTDGRRALIFLLPDTIGTIVLEEIFRPNRDIGYSKYPRNISPIDFIGLKTERLGISEPVQIVRRETNFEAFAKLKLVGSVYFTGIEAGHRFIRWGGETYPWTTLATNRAGDRLMGGAIRWKNRLVVLLPLPHAKDAAIAAAIDPIADFLIRQKDGFWKGVLTPSIDDDDGDLREFKLNLNGPYPDINGRALHYYSRDKARYKKRLTKKHIDLLRWLGDSYPEIASREDALAFLGCKAPTLNQLIHELRQSFMVALPEHLIDRALRTKGIKGIRLSIPTARPEKLSK